MGKRELLIISLFVVAGTVAYRMAAKPSASPTSRLTWTSFLDTFRADARRNRATAVTSSQGTVELTDTITEARISGISTLSISGGPGRNIQFDLRIEASAQDEAAAKDASSRATLVQDRVGSVLALRLDAARGLRPSATLHLRVPDRLAIRVEGTSSTGRLDVADIDELRLESIVGDVTITRVRQDVTGTHRNGALSVTHVGAAHLSLVSSKAVLEDVRGDSTITARNGQLHVRGGGTIELDLTNQQTTVDAPGGTVHVLGSGGELALRTPSAPVTIDVRRMAVDVTLSRAVPVAVLTSDALAHLGLIGLPAITLDVRATDGGRIRATDLPATATTSGVETRLHHAIGAGSATVALRNQRADIVIDAMK